MVPEELWNTYVKEHIGLSVAIAAGAVLLIIGLVNYIRAFRSVSKGIPLSPPRNTTASPIRRSKKDRLLPSPLFWGGVFLTFLPFLLRFADLRYGIRLSEHLPLEGVWDVTSAAQLEYRFEMLVFRIGAVVATALLFIAYYRECRKEGWKVWSTILVWFFTYNIALQVVYKVCLMAGEDFLGSQDSASLLYACVIYLYMILWGWVQKLLSK